MGVGGNVASNLIESGLDKMKLLDAMEFVQYTANGYF